MTIVLNQPKYDKTRYCFKKCRVPEVYRSQSPGGLTESEDNTVWHEIVVPTLSRKKTGRGPHPDGEAKLPELPFTIPCWTRYVAPIYLKIKNDNIRKINHH